MKFFRIPVIVAFAFLLVSGCNKFDDLRKNPNNPDVSTADVDLFLNHVQISFAMFWGNDPDFNFTANDLSAPEVRMEVMFGPLYENAYQPAQFDRMWEFAYTGVFKHANALVPLAEERKLYVHAGIAQVLKAYTAMTLVDLFGDVPYSEANLGSQNINPKKDGGRDVYNEALKLLDSAIDNFGKEPAGMPTNDLFYKGNTEKWRKCAKTLKLRAYLQTRLVDEATSKEKIGELIAEDDLINSDADEFIFPFGTQQDNPNSQHPKYVRNYRASGGALDYIGTHYLWALLQEKGIIDPRIRYYFYRQTLLTDGWDAFTLPCYYRNPPSHFPADMPFCILPGGYWGRDHGNNEGIPPDTDKRTIWGLYPAGGVFDDSQGRTARLGDGGKGQGIFPIWLASYTEFLKAEAALTLQTDGDPRDLLEAGVRKSIARVISFPAQAGVTVPGNRIPTQATIDNYANKVLSLYDAAASEDTKLNVVMKEWYLALWGNGIDAFNNYRRTGKPDNLQYANTSTPGVFMRSLWYPSEFANLNINGTQKAGVNEPVFWDTNPADLYKY